MSKFCRRSSLRLFAHGLALRPWRPNATLRILHSDTRPSQSTSESQQSDTTVRGGDPPQRSKHSALIRTWKFIQSPADAFAIIRAVERKYGRISEYRFARDYEEPTGYQALIHVRFHSQESVDLISEGAEVLHVPAPPTIPNRPGGIGLEELQGLLDAKGRDVVVEVPDFGTVMSGVIDSEEEAKTGSKRIIDCRIQRSATEFCTPSQVPIFGPSRRVRESIARNFLNWGGFHEFQPIENTIPINESFPSDMDHIRMRQCLRMSSRFIGVPNPYEIRAGSDDPPKLHLGSQSDQGETITATQPLHNLGDGTMTQEASESVPTEWEPLPGFESVSEDDYVPTPNANATTIGQSTSESPPGQPPSTMTVTPPTAAPPQPTTQLPTLDPTIASGKVSDNAKPMKPTARNQTPDHRGKTAAQLEAAKNLLRQERQYMQARQQQKDVGKGSGKGGKGRKEPERPDWDTVPKRKNWEPMKKQEQNEHITDRLKNLIGGWF